MPKKKTAPAAVQIMPGSISRTLDGRRRRLKPSERSRIDELIDRQHGAANHATVAANMVDVARGRGLTQDPVDNARLQEELDGFYRLQRAGEVVGKFGRLVAGG